MYKETNCKNCGAPLHYEYGKSVAICMYCKTEYHLDNLGRIEEYKVELDVFGERKRFYISEIRCNPITESYRTISGELTTNMISNKLTLELIEI